MVDGSRWSADLICIFFFYMRAFTFFTESSIFSCLISVGRLISFCLIITAAISQGASLSMAERLALWSVQWQVAEAPFHNCTVWLPGSFHFNVNRSYSFSCPDLCSILLFPNIKMYDYQILEAQISQWRWCVAALILIRFIQSIWTMYSRLFFFTVSIFMSLPLLSPHPVCIVIWVFMGKTVSKWRDKISRGSYFSLKSNLYFGCVHWYNALFKKKKGDIEKKHINEILY